jgi:tetratricopeptide (TPR) repeat protein
MPGKSASAVEDFARTHLSVPITWIDTPFWPILEKCLAKDSGGRPTLAELRREVITLAGRAGITLLSMPRADQESDELYARAQSLSSLGEGRSALEAIEEYIGRFPQISRGWTQKGVILLHLDRIDEAMAATRESLRRDPGNSHAWNNLGVAPMRKEQDLEAVAAFRRALEHDPYNTGSMMSLADILARQGESDAPARLLTRALHLHPKKKLLFNASNTAAQIMKNGGGEEARELLECLTENKPENPRSWFNLARVHQIAERNEEAIECYQRGIGIEPKDSTALICLALCLAKRADLSEAIEVCEKCLQLGAERQKALTLKAQYLNAQGHYSTAVRILADELKVLPNADMLWFTLAVIHDANGALSEAQSALLTCKSILVQEKQFDTDNYRMVEDFLRRLEGDPS